MSNEAWPLVPLASLLTRNERLVTLIPDQQYREVTIRLWGKGVFLRQIVNGADIASQRRSQVTHDQFIVSRIDARNGAMGLVPADLDGAVVTNDFPTFNVNRERLVPAFLGWLCRTESFVDTCRSASEGTTNRVRLKEERFLKQEIRLPPLKEQERIVSRIDSLVSKLEEAKQASKKVAAQSRLLAVSLAHRADLSRQEKEAMGWREVILGNVLCEDFDDHRVAPTQEYPNFGLYSYGRGLFVEAPISGMATSATRLRRVRAGQFIYSRLFAWEGAFGMVSSEFDGWFVSGEYPTFACNQSEVLPEFVLAYIQAKQAWDAVAVGSKGLGSRRQRVQPEQILAHRLMLPPMHVQRQLKNLNSFVPEIEETRSKLKIEIDAMLPSILDSAFKGAL